MTPSDITFAFLPTLVNIPDGSYACPTLAWLQGPFWDSFQADRFAKVGMYSRKNDCDNWARAYAQHAEDCHAATLAGSDSEALAVGEFWYTKDTGKGHAIVVVFVENQQRVFIEPQDGSILNLSQKEISSCSFVRF